jgi:serine phosphatase RsbU (regulator of sigma subunit)
MVDDPLRVLLVEDDEGDAVLVQAHLRLSDLRCEVLWVRSLEDAARAMADAPVACALVDLGLPDATELDALERLLAAAPDLPIVVLTGLHDGSRGVDAVAAGAQDYLVKGETSPETLSRSLRYAVARAQAEAAGLELVTAELRRAENLRLERGLLPRPWIKEGELRLTTRYRPGRGYSVLAGDFFDAVLTGDGRLRAIIGDVSGHGPDEAALGVSMRIAWRTLVLAGLPDDEVLPDLQRVLLAERSYDQFVTACDLTITADRSTVEYRVAGHWPPISWTDDGPVALPCPQRGMPLGLFDLQWPVATARLPEQWCLLLYTDGVLEGRDASSDDGRLGLDGLIELLGDEIPTDEGVDKVLGQVEDRNGGPLDDDLAVVLIGVGDGAV